MAAGFAYTKIGSQGTFLVVAVVLSILAFISKQPMPREKPVANFVVALTFGLLIPFLASK